MGVAGAGDAIAVGALIGSDDEYAPYPGPGELFRISFGGVDAGDGGGSTPIVAPIKLVAVAPGDVGGKRLAAPASVDVAGDVGGKKAAGAVEGGAVMGDEAGEGKLRSFQGAFTRLPCTSM